MAFSFDPTDWQIVPARTVHNQRGELVLSGQHKYLLRTMA